MGADNQITNNQITTLKTGSSVVEHLTLIRGRGFIPARVTSLRSFAIPLSARYGCKPRTRSAETAEARSYTIFPLLGEAASVAGLQGRYSIGTLVEPS